ncbi:TetR/AcrR family transcriptional regulator [Kistimonas asteriae]|uniref:TetR/AcrR family transcriptional regulator n=1 Tax=Kistimonas asteriae TaxID=517724 RepID=UPI001BA4D7DA|nr:TetR/AcrR family transcriptional regulator [Kistimonas asteriae]
MDTSTITKKSGVLPVPKTAHKAAIREANVRKILAAATRCFAINGFKGTSTGDIARLVNLPKSNVHYYFPSKQDLYLEVLKTTAEAWMQDADVFLSEHDPAQSLMHYITQKCRASLENPEGSRLWANEVISGAPFVSDYITSEVKPWLDQCVAVIEQWQRDKLIEPVDGRQLMYMIWASTQHFADFAAQIKLLGDKDQSWESQVQDGHRTLVTILLRGLGLTAPETIPDFTV